MGTLRHQSPARREARRIKTLLRLWSRMAQLALGTKYVTVEACNPPASPVRQAYFFIRCIA
jgi:hypothetical protein